MGRAIGADLSWQKRAERLAMMRIGIVTSETMGGKDRLISEAAAKLAADGVALAGIAKVLSLDAAEGLLQYRSFGYGHYYGREAGLELREDCDTVWEPGMVISMEPMITIPKHLPEAGSYCEYDILVITD